VIYSSIDSVHIIAAARHVVLGEVLS